MSWVNRVQFLLLPWSNNGSSITGLTTQNVPGDRERETQKERERGMEQTERERARRGSTVKRSSQHNRLARKKRLRRRKRRKQERSCYIQDIMLSPQGFCL